MSHEPLTTWLDRWWKYLLAVAGAGAMWATLQSDVADVSRGLSELRTAIAAINASVEVGKQADVATAVRIAELTVEIRHLREDAARRRGERNEGAWSPAARPEGR